MADKPILFSGSMVRALLDGRKTQTRRVLNPQPFNNVEGFQKVFADPPYFEALYSDNKPVSGAFQDGTPYPKIKYAVGDRLWVREAWRPVILSFNPQPLAVTYDADVQTNRRRWADVPREWTMPKQAAKGNVPSIHMPRWASRLTLIVTDVRVQRLQGIGEDDAVDEGVFQVSMSEDGRSVGWKANYTAKARLSARMAFRDLWDSLNAKRGYGWDQNHWVAAYTFTVHRCNIDQMEAQNV